MKSRATGRFWAAFGALPADIQGKAREAYATFRENPKHPGLRFKKVHSSEPIYAVRVSRDYRAVGVMEPDCIVWFWIGSHEDYDRLLARR